MDAMASINLDECFFINEGVETGIVSMPKRSLYSGGGVIGRFLLSIEPNTPVPCRLLVSDVSLVVAGIRFSESGAVRKVDCVTGGSTNDATSFCMNGVVPTLGLFLFFMIYPFFFWA